jgi:alcohol dehydrogenase (cytochrome c)
MMPAVRCLGGDGRLAAPSTEGNRSAQRAHPGLIADAFTYRWQDGPLSDLFIVMKATMPESRPASLTDEEYVDIVAYLLKKNQYPSGQRGAR